MEWTIFDQNMEVGTFDCDEIPQEGYAYQTAFGGEPYKFIVDEVRELDEEAGTVSVDISYIV